MNFAESKRPRRRPSLTPMIDVVFLLLVFFMLASRFGMDAVLPAPLAGSGVSLAGPPRLVDVLPEAVMLNGIATDEAKLVIYLDALVDSPTDTIVLRSQMGSSVQRIIDVMTALQQAGFQSVILTE